MSFYSKSKKKVGKIVRAYGRLKKTDGGGDRRERTSRDTERRREKDW